MAGPYRRTQTELYRSPRNLVRLFLIQKQQELGIEISPEAVVDRARQMLGSMPAGR